MSCDTTVECYLNRNTLHQDEGAICFGEQSVVRSCTLMMLRITPDLLKIDNFDVWWTQRLSIYENFNLINEL